MAVTGQGPACSTVTRATLPSGWKSWVMPSFLARMADMRSRRLQVARRISMSTPAGRWSKRCSESTVFGVGWWMSMSRLWVRISKCSRESLSLKGDRITQYTFFSVGSGTGPETVAPVRVAVSTISLAAVSIAVWSYDFRRMRILFWAIVAIFRKLLISLSQMGQIPGFRTRPTIVVSAGNEAAARETEPPPTAELLDDFGHDPGADGAATLADCEPQTLVHGDRLAQLDLHLDVVARHHH